MAMQFEHEFTIPVPVEQAWPVLLDVERIAPCLPGATLDKVEGDAFTGRMKVKVGPITVTYQGKASFEEVDKDAHTVKLKASGKEARGSGTANATVTAGLAEQGGSTKVTVTTTFNVTGRPAQFGRGVMADVGSRLIDRFATNLAGLLSDGGAAEPAASEAEQATAEPAQAPAAEPVAEAAAERPAESPEPAAERRLTAVPTETRPHGTTRASRSTDEEALDLLEIAGMPLVKRLAPVVGGFALLTVAFVVVRRLLRRR
jgi:carbon monoxide dehydrogenase subunit G